MFVNSSSTDGNVDGMGHMLLIQASIATVGLMVTICFYRDRPADVYPSRIAQLRAREMARRRQDKQRIATVPEDDVEGMSAALVDGAQLGVTEVVENWSKLLEDPEFLKLM